MGFAAGIEATRACNFTCEHCFVDAGRRDRDELTTAEVRTLIRELVAAGADEIGWSGGEPLLRRDLVSLTAVAAKLGAGVSLPSNGYFATREKLRALKRAGLDSFQVSLDGDTPERAHRWRHGPRDAFSRACQALRDAADLGLATTVCTLLTPETADELDSMLELARSLGATRLRYTPYSAFGRAARPGASPSRDPWDTPAVRRFAARVEAQPADALVRILLDCPMGLTPDRSSFSCGAGRRVLYVCANGDVYPCTALMHPDYLVGNVRRRPIGELVRSSPMFRIQRELVRETPGGACARCSALDRCNGGCPGRTLAATGSVRGEAVGCLHRLRPWTQESRKSPNRLTNSRKRTPQATS